MDKKRMIPNSLEEVGDPKELPEGMIANNFLEQGFKGFDENSRAESQESNNSIQSMSISHKKLNKLLKGDEKDGGVSPEAYQEALQILKDNIESTKVKKEESKKKLQRKKKEKKELEEYNKEWDQRIEDLVMINDNDRETILNLTKEMDRLKNHQKVVRNKLKNKKPGTKIEIEGKFEIRVRSI